MATDPVTPPPGFTLDQPQAAAGTVQPPPGFKLDAPAAPSGPPQTLGHGASEFWDQVNPVAGVKGLAQMVRHPIDTLTADSGARQQIWHDAAGAFKGGDYATAIRKGVAGAIPLLGPQMDRSGDQFQSGDVAGGIGSTAGIAANLLAPEVLRDVHMPALPAAAEGAARKLYQSALKPRTTLGAGRAGKAVSAGLENAVPVSPAGVDRLAGVIDDLNSKVGDQIQQAGPSRQISPAKALANVDELKGRFSEQVNPTSDMNAIDASKQDFIDTLGGGPRDLSASEAQAMKTGTYRQLKGRAYGELKSASIEAQKALARGLKDAIAEAFPEIADANGKLSGALELEPLLDKAVTRISNHNVMGIGAPLAASAAKAATGSSAIAAATGLIKHIVGLPAIKSRLAIALYKGSKGQITIPTARLRVQGYVNSLGEGAEAAQNAAPQQTYPKAAENDQQDAPAMSTALETPAGNLSRAASGQFVSDKSRLSEFAQP